MSSFAALALYPLWAVALTVAITALRLGRDTPRGLVALGFAMAVWVTGLILLVNESTATLAEHVLPLGFLLAGTFVHAAVDVAKLDRRRVVLAMYALSFAVALTGFVAPRLFYGPGGRSPGPLFWPLAALSAVGSSFLVLRTALTAGDATGRERRRRLALALGCAAGSLGGGGVVGLRVLGIGDVFAAAPLLLASVLLIAYAVVTGERGRARDLVVQGLVYATATAAVSAVGLVVFFHLLPSLAPGASFAWLALVCFLAILPLDPLRVLFVEVVARRVFARPTGTRDLAEAIEASEVRADQAERLAEIGKLASAVAHEIRNPLGVLAAHAKLLEKQGADEETIAAMKQQIDRAKRFLDDLLRYSKPRPIEPVEIEIAPALRLVASDVRRVIGEGAPEVIVEAEDEVTIEADRGGFTDVATVLFTNASIALDGKRDGRIDARASVDGEDLVVIVEDNGAGVPSGLEATLFQPFVTGRGRDARHPGTGLGLAIAARWLDRHGGALRYERRSEGGARFIARWPRRPR